MYKVLLPQNMLRFWKQNLPGTNEHCYTDCSSKVVLDSFNSLGGCKTGEGTLPDGGFLGFLGWLGLMRLDQIHQLSRLGSFPDDLVCVSALVAPEVFGSKNCCLKPELASG